MEVMGLAAMGMVEAASTGLGQAEGTASLGYGEAAETVWGALGWGGRGKDGLWAGMGI